MKRHILKVCGRQWYAGFQLPLHNLFRAYCGGNNTQKKDV